MQWPLRRKKTNKTNKAQTEKQTEKPIAQKEKKTEETKTDSKYDKVIGNRFVIKEKIGSGSFGEVRVAIDLKTKKEVAIKLEHKSDLKKHLKTEYEVYTDLNGCKGFPNMLWFGKWSDYTVLVMDRLGPSIKKMYSNCNHKFSVKTVSAIAIQMLDRLENLHSRGWLHQDIKPENIVTGLNEDNQNIYCLDFGTSNRFIDPISKKHVTKGPSTKIVGTARYSSLNNHYGQKQSRRDDLESLGYTLIYWMIGRLPWQGIPENDFRIKWRKVRRLKRNTSPDELCYGLPVEFRIYLKYCFKLSFTQRPNYSYLRGLFRRLIEREVEENNKITQTEFVNESNKHSDFAFDWQKLQISG